MIVEKACRSGWPGLASGPLDRANLRPGLSIVLIDTILQTEETAFLRLKPRVWVAIADFCLTIFKNHVTHGHPSYRCTVSRMLKAFIFL